MNVRKVFFWFHLLVGCSAALFIFLMSITGVALTYERQMIQSGVHADYPQPPHESAEMKSIDELLVIAKGYKTKKAAEIVVENVDNAPVLVKDGRKTLAYLNPYTGEEMAEPGVATKQFFRKLRAFHRWLTLDGSFSENGRLVNGIANVIFILLVLTGMYLWLPKRFNKRSFKQGLTLNKSHPNKTARNYQWHNVFGIYMAPVLFIIVVTAVFFSFKWPGQTLKEYVSTESTSLSKPKMAVANSIDTQLTKEQQLNIVKAQYPQWRTIRFSLPAEIKLSYHFHIDYGTGGEPQKRESIAIDAVTGKILETVTFEQYSAYRKIRSYIRFLHTGEVYGLTGQTIAGIASLLACILVYTGVMLSWVRWKNSRARKIANLSKVEAV